MTFSYGSLVEKDSFIGEYMAMMEEQETARAYDFWCAAWLLSLALGRECVVDRPRAPVFLNLYAILTAESGVTRKSSAIRVAAKIAKEFTERVKPRMMLVDGPTSLEAFIEMMAMATEQYGASHVGLVASELATSLGRTSSAAGLPVLLTDLYDCPESRSGATLARGSWELKNVFLSFLAASTPSWLLRAVSPDVVEGGFTSRTLFVHSEKRKKSIPWPVRGENEDAQRRYFVDYLLRIRERASIRRAVRIDDGARELFSSWYRKRKIFKDAFRSSFASREDSHVLRLAAIIAVSRDAWTMADVDIQRAVKVVESLRENGAALFSTLPNDPNSDVLETIDKVRTLLLHAGINGMKQKDITLRCGGSVAPILEVMHELKMVDKFEVRLVGRPATWWRATRYIMSTSVREIMEVLLRVETSPSEGPPDATADYEDEFPHPVRDDRGTGEEAGS